MQQSYATMTWNNPTHGPMRQSYETPQDSLMRQSYDLTGQLDLAGLVAAIATAQNPHPDFERAKYWAVRLMGDVPDPVQLHGRGISGGHARHGVRRAKRSRGDCDGAVCECICNIGVCV